MSFNPLHLIIIYFLASFAHSSHDHSAPMAGFIYLLWITSIFIVAVYLLKKLINNNKEFYMMILERPKRLDDKYLVEQG